MTWLIGSGKTAAMSKAAAQIFLIQQTDSDSEIRDRPIIIRFCGTSSMSTNGRGLVCSLINHIRFSQRLPFNPIADTTSYEQGKFVDFNLHLFHLINKSIYSRKRFPRAAATICGGSFYRFIRSTFESR